MKDTPPALPLWRNGVALFITGLAAALCWSGRNFNTASEAGVIMDLPYRVGHAWGSDQAPAEAERRLLPEDTQIVRKIYDTADGDKIQLSIVLSGGEKRSIHQPEVCLPAQGWTIERREIIPVPLANGSKLPVMKLALDREIAVGPGKRQRLRSFFLYWFVGRDKTTPSHWERIFFTSWDRIAHHLNHRWAYVSLTSEVGGDRMPGGKTPEQTLEMLETFLAQAAPSFHKPGVLPGGKS